jgi:NADH dehydrogenase
VNAPAPAESTTRHRVVVVGGGFAGLQAVKALQEADVDVTLVDRNNYHLFQPLSYQVATGALSPAEIAQPLRRIFRSDPNVRVVMGEVTELALDRRAIVVVPPEDGPTHEIPYDTLVVAGGSAYNYFGHDEWRPLALEVKSLESAIEVRARILRAFEAAELEPDPEVRRALLTFVIVGAGPTGVEMAGQIGELARDTLSGDFRAIDPAQGRVLLVEIADRVLTAFPESLSKKAGRALEQLGVTPMTGHTVTDITTDAVELKDTSGAITRIPTRTVIWAAGVAASGLATMVGEACGAQLDRVGRVAVEPDLTLPGHPEVFALGDMVALRDPQGGDPIALPGLAPAAMQQGRYAAKVIADRLAGRPAKPFKYLDKGQLATIGRARGVADIHGLRLSGPLAWMTWLLVHIFYLIGFQNRVIVLIRWAVGFLTRGRGARLITDRAQRDQSS